ncbi:nucleotide disphospho-sugar-binding domain-containing protein [Micromonospora auratinigra]|uniref:UDP:flavonoid glycosyltransferase YjiC, YdhE family n=1 Tax=Micromonospora auratinigra TaxID=261654 RepID=A0A1A8ZFT2_9ACTN|nr:nucleotide disphospho-sugar-binding domain-containing protein [Micromonospora auratinigra]SBT42737.1 UDP:flavonoid glycosyltransferase YjiC, YdhE family [Micromonospora auratinigra]
MRALFTASNWPGHWFCMVPLGWALQAAGHEVRVACPPEQADRVSAAGLVPVPALTSPDMMLMARLGNYVDAVLGRRTLPGMPLHPITGEPVARLDEFDLATEGPRIGERIADGLRRSFDAAVEVARAWRPDLILNDMTAEEGQLAAEVLGVPAVHCTPGLYGTVEPPDGPDLGPADPTGAFPRYGLGEWDRGRIRHVLDPTPASVPLPFGDAARLPVRYLPYNGPGELPEWAVGRGDRPRVTVIWGSSVAPAPALHTAVRTATESGAEVVLTVTPEHAEALGELPDGVRVLHQFPLHLLLATSDAIIHHGSGNSLMTAAAAGVPQVALANNDDQIPVSRRLAATGAVLALPALEASADDVAGAVKTVLHDDAPRAAARRLRAEIESQPAPADLVPALEQLATGGR